MRVLRRLALAALVALAAAAATAEPAAACSCVQLDPRSALAAADAAFVGRLVERRVVDAGRQQAVFVFAVERAVKGRLDGHVEVHAPLSSASCGLAAELGTRAGLLLYRRGEAWTSSLCS